MFWEFFGVGNPLDVIFVRFLRFLKETDHAIRLLAVFCFRWTYPQLCTSKNGQTSVQTKVVHIVYVVHVVHVLHVVHVVHVVRVVHVVHVIHVVHVVHVVPVSYTHLTLPTIYSV